MDLSRLAQRANELRAVIARNDPNTFIEYVLQDETTTAFVQQAPHHIEFQRIIDAHQFVVLWSFIESAKTQNIAIGRLLYELGRNPNLRVGVCSNTYTQAEKLTGLAASYIEKSERLHKVFPKLQPNKRIWSARRFNIAGHNLAKDPTVQAIGSHGNVLGARLDLLIMDDILDYENTRTDAQRKSTIEWVESTLLGRIAEHGRIWMLGVAWHSQDLMHVFSERPGWFSKRFAVWDEQQQPRWPERWPRQRIERAKMLGPVEFARQLLCEPRASDGGRFKQEWVDRALQSGRKRRLIRAVDRPPPGYAIVLGVDIGVQKHAKADLCSFATVLLHPNGTRELIWLETGRFSGPEIVDKIMDHYQRYQCIVVVENVAAQDFIVQFARQRSIKIPIRPYTTGRGQASLDFQVEMLMTEFANGYWIIPNTGGVCVYEVTQLIGEMVNYTPTSHCGDRLASVLFARFGIANLALEPSSSGHVDLRL